MALNDIIFRKSQGGLGRPQDGEDYIAGYIGYVSSLPSGFTSSDRVKVFYQIEDAEAAGITDDYSDETKATGSYLVTNAGAEGDTVTVKVAEHTDTVTLCSYTRTSTDTTAALVATAITAAINAGTDTHGYTASVATATVTITARQGLGIFLNSGTPLSVTISGTVAGTITQFTGGVASVLAVHHYHISEYFRMIEKISGQGKLYVGMYAVPGGTPTFTEISTVQTYAEKTIRQMFVYNDFTAFATSQVTTIQGVVDTLSEEHAPLSILYAGNIAAVTNLSSLSDLRSLDSENVSVVVGQDGANTGFELFKAYGKSITCGGATLGTLAAIKVHENIGNVAKCNLSTGTELEVAAFANGTKFRDVSSSLLSQINMYKYIFLRKLDGLTGTYFNDSHTSTSATSDYCYIENVRTIDKAIRMQRAALLPALNSNLRLNSDGTMTDGTIAYLESLGNQALEQMIRDEEISAGSTTIDTTQKPQSTGKVSVSTELISSPVARNFEVKIGYTQSL
jgi:hypothetical protein